MNIGDVIRDCKTTHEVYFWMTSYVEAVRYADNLGLLPEHLKRLPLKDKEDLNSRLTGLAQELDRASKQLDDPACVLIKEGIYVFGTALKRIKRMDGGPAKAGRTAEFPAQNISEYLRNPVRQQKFGARGDYRDTPERRASPRPD
jgi:hypothetical protein